jgi:asparagine synthase (glutamine-hydrolysing)
MLGEVSGRPARTFSIGFDAAGYDEMEFARIAARHFKTKHHEYYVTPDDLVRSIPEVARWYDQPFGNSSVLPSFFCARMAKEAGIEKILGGDGGDELFGGNSRYAKQRIFAVYDGVPRMLRSALLEPALLGAALPARIPLLRKAVSYVEQARVPMPGRSEMYNLLLRLGLTEVLTPQFLDAVDTGAPLRDQQRIYAACEADALINRMLAFDWRYTLADNDLPKVMGATAMAGIDTGFPLLDDRLVEFSLRLHPELKLKGLQLRWFFKEALRGFLPDAIITKKKHGFGLPFGSWLIRHRGLKDLAQDSLAELRKRGIIRPPFLDALMTKHVPSAPEYYGEMVWILMMLEQWLRSRTTERNADTPQMADT